MATNAVIDENQERVDRVLELKKITDPEKVQQKVRDLDETMTLRHIEALVKVVDPSTEMCDTERPASLMAPNVRTDPDIPKHVTINCSDILNRVSESLEESAPGVAYYIGKDDKRLSCGHVLQVVPTGGFTSIGGGKSVMSDAISGSRNRFEKDLQICVKVHSEDSSVVVMAKNGCVVLSPGSEATFNMPVFVVKRNGEYYYLKTGQRVLTLSPGMHFVIYAYERPIIFADIDKSEALSEVQALPEPNGEQNPLEVQVLARGQVAVERVSVVQSARLWLGGIVLAIVVGIVGYLWRN